MELVITRTYYPTGTNGMLSYKGQHICATIELPWRFNEPQVSCIPEGHYPLVKRTNRKHGHHLMVCDVPGRSLILIHPANDARKELKGCIAPVLITTGIGKGLASRAACAKLHDLIEAEGSDTLELRIVKAMP